MSLEEAMEYIREDEYLEITPTNLRIRKIILDEIERKRARIAAGYKDEEVGPRPPPQGGGGPSPHPPGGEGSWRGGGPQPFSGGGALGRAQP